jgi:hypothetical protein
LANLPFAAALQAIVTVDACNRSGRAPANAAGHRRTDHDLVSVTAILFFEAVPGLKRV